MIFVCDKCGICCKHIGQVPQLKQFDSGDGKCIHLTEDNLCDIYSDRPDICNVDKTYELLFKEKMAKEEYIKLNIKICNELKNKYGT
ncbi:MAG: YkgJ family cysteine cluster protein [Firmicutes bacterium]|nr:YkgJ family cysteine cluster protein [Bacillota bacterium]